MKITVETTIDAPVEAIWKAWNTPEDILVWNTASDTWHTTRSEVDLREGGKFSSRMEPKDTADGIGGFDFAGTYTRVVPYERIESIFGDRTLVVEFLPGPGGVTVRETFDADPEHAEGFQRAGWQAILDNFARYVMVRVG
jgi:uncharacterized protein YndB with AHSA1/START domain